MLNKIAGVLKYAPDKIGAGVVERWDWIFEYLWISTTLSENGSHYGTKIQFCSNFPHKYTTLKSIIKLATK